MGRGGRSGLREPLVAFGNRRGGAGCRALLYIHRGNMLHITYKRSVFRLQHYHAREAVAVTL